MDIDIEYVAKLARIDLSKQQQNKFARQLKDILAYIEKLKELDVSAVEPISHVLPLDNVFRQDKLTPSLTLTKVLTNAPAKEGDSSFSVPSIIDGSASSFDKLRTNPERSRTGSLTINPERSRRIE